MGLQHLNNESVVMLARAADLELPSEDVELLLAALKRYATSVAELERLDLDGVDPAVTFDARWPA
jgi:Asp-tRNA(Asn)/Glu-tRNA(Gln) amidotransferase C subunit